MRAPKYANDKAEVVVSFENFGEKQEIVFLLAMQNSAWKITDIKYADGGSLLEMLDGGD